jgi:lipase chaperone LimK
MKAIIISALLAVALLVAWPFDRDAGDPPPHTADTQGRQEQPKAAGTPRPMVSQRGAAPAVEIPSLRGTEVDGNLFVDAAGDLIVDAQLRDLFDYFYTTVGEVTFDEATAAIRQHLEMQLVEPALGQALDLLQDYIDYKTALTDLERQFPVIADLDGLRAREEAVQRLRASLFSAAAHEAFFGAEEAYNAFTLERLTLLQDDRLPRDEVAERIEILRTSLPEEVQALLIPQIHQQLNDETAALQARGAASWEVRELRLSLVGPEATERLEALDQERSAWQQRLDAFERERQSILSFPGLAEQDRQAAVEALLQDNFQPSERLRVAALLDPT